MRSLEYRSVVGRKPKSEAEAGAYVLQLGSVALEPISYATLVTMQACPAVIRRVLDACFLGQPMMWEDVAVLHAAGYGEQLREIEEVLSTVDCDLRQNHRPGGSVVAQIVGLWRELTFATRRGLEEPTGGTRGGLTRTALAEYRRRAFAFVEALRQLLPVDDRCSIETRDRLRRARTELESLLPAGANHLAEASWRQAADARDAEEPGFVTWGIP